MNAGSSFRQLCHNYSNDLCSLGQVGNARSPFLWYYHNYSNDLCSLGQVGNAKSHFFSIITITVTTCTSGTGRESKVTFSSPVKYVCCALWRHSFRSGVCRTLPYIAVHCRTSQYIAVHRSILPYIAGYCSTLPYIAVYCSTLPYIAVHCRILQYVAVHCSTPPAGMNSLDRQCCRKLL